MQAAYEAALDYARNRTVFGSPIVDYELTRVKLGRMATIIQASRWFKRGQQAFQDTGAVVELGQLRYTQKLDPDVAALLGFLRRVTT